MEAQYRPLDTSTLGDLVCGPGGLKLDGKVLLGDLSEVARWHRERLTEGMRGLVAYRDGMPRGFVEIAPAEVAPLPIEAPGAAVLLCFHWAGTDPDDPDHLEQERRMLEAAIAEARRHYTGLAALGWNHPTHYPIPLLTALGFRELERHEPIALLWLAFRKSGPLPRLGPARFSPRDLRRDGLVAVDAAWSSRCLYSLHFADRISLRTYRIDTRDEAFRLAVSPWDWGWIYVNGTAINPFAFPGERLAQEISRQIP